ncbi:MAG TPA: M48 family metallopeptidase [Ignavibacteria bacterium]|nr:M48 family metallopeptidase [Ignavibacteria bacterium]
MNKGRFLIAAVIAIISVIIYFTRTQENPVTGEKQRVSLTPEEEVILGLNTASQMKMEFGGDLKDVKINGIVDRVGNKIVNSTEAKNSPYQFEFHILADDKTVNAFALPGGQIFITYGLYKLLNTEDQLAGVLSHEIAHVINRHGAEHMAQQELTQGLINAGDMAMGSPSEISRFIGNFVNMKYGREDEIESDEYGVKYLIESGYKPEAMIEVMEILEEASGGRTQPEFLSTHPNPGNRIEKIKEAIRKYGEK